VLARVGAHASTVSPSSVVGAGRAAGIARPPTPLGALALAASVGQQCRPARRAFWPRVVAIAKGVALVRGKLSKAQVVAYLLADTLGIEILEGGAMRLGENATKDAVAAKDGAQKLRNVVWDLTPPCRKAPA
jgi:hypothetical protein